MSSEIIGTICFGIVVGWVTYRTLRRQSETVSLSNIASVIGSVGGGAVVSLFNTHEAFAYYSMGLFVGFFGYLIVALTIGKDAAFLGGD